MKRTLIAVLLASIAGSAIAADGNGQAVPGFRPGFPYSDLEVDRALPNVKDPVVDQSASVGATSAEDFTGFQAGLPYEQAQVDRALPNVKDPVISTQGTQVAGPASASPASASSGATSPRPFGPGATGPGTHSLEATGPWANDWNFIAPAQ